MKYLFLIGLILFVFVSGCVQNIPVNEPEWIREYIKENSPLWVSKCEYKNATVYYIPSSCCDQFNYLYNENGEKICAPDGGLTGNGDGRCSDFSIDDNQNCRFIWQDPDAFT